MRAESISEVVQQAVEWTGMEQVPVEDRTRFLSDRGPGFLARVLEDYLQMLEIRHIYCSPYHPQTNDKLEAPSTENWVETLHAEAVRCILLVARQMNTRIPDEV